MMPALDRIAEIRARFGAGGVSSPPSTTAFASTLAGASAALNTADVSSLLGTTGITASSGGGAAGSSTTGANDLTAQLTSMLTAANGLTDASRAALTRILSASGSTSTASSTGAVARPATPPANYDDWASTIGDIATEEGVPASLLGALVWSESSFNPDAVSNAGARGLAQLMPATATGLGVDIDNPVDNLRGGAQYLRQVLDRFGRSDLALAAYTAGPGAVEQAGGVPAYPETQSYVATVLGRAQTLAGTKA
jgi:soluble lytic murein transglycosylase-like protein